MLSDNFSPNTLRPIFSHALALRLETIKLDAFIQNYSAGQTLSGKVIQVLPEQKAVVELNSEKLLLQFPRAVTPGQNIAIKIEQTHPNPILKLTDFTSFNSSQKSVPNSLTKEVFSLNVQAADKTSLQNRPARSPLETSVPDKNAAPGVKNDQAALNGRTIGSLSKTDLKQLGIEVGQKGKAEILQVVNRETLQVRLNGNEVTLKHAASQKLQPGESVYIQVKSTSPGKFVLEVEPLPASSATAQSSPDRAIFKSYLPARQPLVQVFAGLKEAFLENPSTQLKELKVDQTQLKQLQANLQKIVSREFKSTDAIQLKELIDRTGFHYEAKIKNFVLEPDLSNKNALLENDLKGQLLRLARQLEQLSIENTVSDKFISKLMTQVNQAVSNIELQQLVHHFSREEQQPLLLQLPENLLGEEDRLKIYILPDQQEGANRESDPQNRTYSLVFLLNLSALGDLKIETRIFKDEVSIHITSSNSDAIQFIQAHVSELEDVFRQEGFFITVTGDHEPDASMEAPDSLGQLLIETPLQIVDLKT